MKTISRLRNVIYRNIIIAQSSVIFRGKIRRFLLRLTGVVIRDRVVISHGVKIMGASLTLDEGAFVNVGVLIDTAAPVWIGRNVHIAPEAALLTATHRIGSSSCRAGMPHQEPITVEHGCWIGARAVILPGVRIAQGCIIGAGAVVTRNTQPNGLYVGSPARRLRDL